MKTNFELLPSERPKVEILSDKACLNEFGSLVTGKGGNTSGTKKKDCCNGNETGSRKKGGGCY